MWVETFREVAQTESTLASVLLKDRIPLSRKGSRLSGTLIERASGALAVPPGET